MYEVIEMFSRRDKKTPFFREASAENKAANDAYSAAEAGADGNRGRTDAETRDGLTFIVTIMWRDKDAADAFTGKAASEHTAFVAARRAYYKHNRIKHRTFTADVA